MTTMVYNKNINNLILTVFVLKINYGAVVTAMPFIIM